MRTTYKQCTIEIYSAPGVSGPVTEIHIDGAVVADMEVAELEETHAIIVAREFVDGVLAGRDTVVGVDFSSRAGSNL